MEKFFNAVIVDRKEIAEDTYEIIFELNCENFYFVPGQYVWVVLPELQYPDERGNRRPFSILSRFKGKNNQISCAFRKSGSGFKQTLISMPIGSALRIDGPFGFCTLPQDEATPIVFIVGGVGITSVLTMIRYATINKSSRRIILLYVNRDSKRAVYLDELENLQQENKIFTLISYFGDLTSDLIFNNTKDIANPIWYVFGPEALVFAVGEMLIKNNIHPDKIKTEEFRLSASPFYQKNIEVIKTAKGLKMALDNAFNHIIVTDSEGKIVYANHGAEIITGYSIKEMLSSTPRLWGGLMSGDFYKSLWKIIKEDVKTFEGEFTNRKKSGDIYIARVKISPFFNPKNNNLIGFVGVEEDITKEKEIDHAKSEFVTMASHQLRSLLTAISWTAEQLLENRDISARALESVTDIMRSVSRLTVLVDSLLNLSRIESGTISITPQRLDIVVFLKNYFKEVHPFCEKKNIVFHFNILVSKLEAVIDKSAFQNIIQSIVANAIEYTFEKGSVEVSLEKKENTFLVTVRDTGIGIPPEEDKKVFGKFFRASNAMTIKAGGTGVGLYIASEATKLLGGKIWFESQLNKGTTFYIELPLIVLSKEGTRSFT